MSFLNRAFASIGIGSAKVDTKLDSSQFIPGETVTGIVDIKGGNVEQQVDEIYLSVMTSYEKEVNDRKVKENVIIQKCRLTEGFVLKADERKEIPFSFTLALDTPITLGRSKVWIQTGLDIKLAIDPTDHDYIEVLPHPYVRSCMNALEDLGFTIYQVANELAPMRLRHRLPFVQEIEYKAHKGPFYRRLDEIDTMFIVEENQLTLFLEVDRAARGLAGFLSEITNTDETLVRLTFTKSELANATEVRRRIEETIQMYS